MMWKKDGGWVIANATVSIGSSGAACKSKEEEMSTRGRWRGAGYEDTLASHESWNVLDTEKNIALFWLLLLVGDSKRTKSTCTVLHTPEGRPVHKDRSRRKVLTTRCNPILYYFFSYARPK